MSPLQQLNRSWLRAWFEKDVAAVERMMSESYFYVAANGVVLDRNAILRIIESPTYKLERGEVSEERVVDIAPGVAALLHRFQGAGSYEGNRFVDDQRCITIFVKRGDDWVFAFEQVTAIR